MDKITINTIEWEAPEYIHKEKSMDFLWTIGVIALVGAIIAIWFGNYVFAIFILIAGGCLIMFTLRKPEMVKFVIENEGIRIGKDLHVWKNVKSFDIKSGEPFGKLLIETTKYFLPIYTISLPNSIKDKIEDELLKVTERKEIPESQSMAFAEKIGF